ncbi:MAG: hypothetical protein JWO19_4497 [Bryobacterales bacterium]|nr:hypothetical protein [Bryobacterales bacterium]
MSKLTPFKYAVVQFHRNPLRGEPFNLGLLVVAGNHQSFVKLEPSIKSVLKLDQIEYRAVEACLNQLRDVVQKDSVQLTLLDQLSASYRGKIQITEVRGGLAEDVQSEVDSLFQTFVAHPRIKGVRGPEKGAAKDLNLILRENKLLGKYKVKRHYTIGINESDQVKLDFGYALKAGHVAIEALDLTLPGREERLEEVGPAAGKFQFLRDKLKQNVTRYAAVKTNGVDAGWELAHIAASSDAVFNIESESQKLITQIEQHLAAASG